MKKLLLMTFSVIVLVVGVGFLYHPTLEEYGETTVQYDEQTSKYFAEVTTRYEVEPTVEMKTGMPVSYYKTDKTVLRVSSKLETKEEILARAESEVKVGLYVGGAIGWCIGVFFLWGEYRRQKRYKVKFSNMTERR